MPINAELLQRLENNDENTTKIHLTHQTKPLISEDMRLIADAINKNNNPYVKTIIVPNSAIGDEGIAYLSQISTIRYLAVDAANLTDKSVAGISNLPHLQVLRISANKLTLNGFKSILEHCKELNTLAVNNNNILINTAEQDSVLTLIASNPNLSTLLIEDVGIKDKDKIPQSIIKAILDSAKSHKKNHLEQNNQAQSEGNKNEKHQTKRIKFEESKENNINSNRNPHTKFPHFHKANYNDKKNTSKNDEDKEDNKFQNR